MIAMEAGMFSDWLQELRSTIYESRLLSFERAG